ncbi:hypothetical protein FRC10_005558, partial [Ceratobasidium sp. 414]
MGHSMPNNQSNVLGSAEEAQLLPQDLAHGGGATTCLRGSSDEPPSDRRAEKQHEELPFSQLIHTLTTRPVLGAVGPSEPNTMDQANFLDDMNMEEPYKEPTYTPQVPTGMPFSHMSPLAESPMYHPMSGGYGHQMP